ncbi:MAG: ArsR/SmtB family transcription factor [Gemmatimonadales bacterium]
MPDRHTATDLLLTIAEGTRLRILNALAAAPLFVSDLQSLLGLPQPTVSRHLRVLREIGVVRDTPIGPYVVYRLDRAGGPRGRMLSLVLDAIAQDEQMRAERHLAHRRSREHFRERTEALVEALS